MTFKEAYELIKNDLNIKVKRKSWNGFWRWQEYLFEQNTDDKSANSIIMYTGNHHVMDIRQTVDVAFTIDNMMADDWEIATEDNCRAIREVLYGFNTERALEILAKGSPNVEVARMEWNNAEGCDTVFLYNQFNKVESDKEKKPVYTPSLGLNTREKTDEEKQQEIETNQIIFTPNPNWSVKIGQEDATEFLVDSITNDYDDWYLYTVNTK